MLLWYYGQQAHMRQPTLIEEQQWCAHSGPIDMDLHILYATAAAECRFGTHLIGMDLLTLIPSREEALSLRHGNRSQQKMPDREGTGPGRYSPIPTIVCQSMLLMSVVR